MEFFFFMGCCCLGLMIRMVNMVVIVLFVLFVLFLFFCEFEFWCGMEFLYFGQSYFVCLIDKGFVEQGLGCVYYCVLYFIVCKFDMMVSELLLLLVIIKQLFGCVLNELIECDLFEICLGECDCCQCLFCLILVGLQMESDLFEVVWVKMLVVYNCVGYGVVVGYWVVFEVLIFEEDCEQVINLWS